MNKISAIIVVKENPPHLHETLASIDFVDEVIIVDIGMTLACKKELQQYKNLTIVPIAEDIRYVELIREQSKTFATHDTVLFLDPDEVVTPGLKEALTTQANDADYISFPRKNIIFGKWIQHSRWWPDYQVRMFKKNAVRWPARLHAQPEVSGTGYTIEATEHKALLHFNYENITEYLMKMIRYAQAESHELVVSKKIYTIGIAISEALQEFISRFFSEKGYRDGMHGLVLAFMQMMYKFLVYFYYWENLGYKEVHNKEIIQAPQMLFRQGLYETNHWLTQEKLISKASELRNRIINRIL